LRRSQAEKILKPATRNEDEQDVKPSDDELQQPADLHQPKDKYDMKKEMSAKVFRYIVEADEEELKVMKILIDCCVMSCWCEWLNAYTKVKLDDVGDPLLHALDEVLCGSTNVKQLVPAVPSVCVKRTVSTVIFPSTMYWVVLQPT